MQPASEDDIRRAAKAIADAPCTETGLLIPPHVAAAQQVEQVREQAPLLNRAERRWREKQARKRARREKGMSPVALELVAEGEQILGGLNNAQQAAALAMLRDAQGARGFEREAIQDQGENL